MATPLPGERCTVMDGRKVATVLEVLGNLSSKNFSRTFRGHFSRTSDILEDILEDIFEDIFGDMLDIFLFSLVIYKLN